MSIKQKRDQILWEWMQSIGKTSYVWRWVFAGSLYNGVFLYPWKAGVDLAFGWHTADPHYPSLPGFIAALLTGSFGGWIGGLSAWSLRKRKHRTALSPQPPLNHALQRTEAGGTSFPSS